MNEAAWERAYEASMAEEYEWYCTRDHLESQGWHVVEISKRPFDHMQEIANWLRENCKGEYEHKLVAAQFLFERERDANWFALKWS